jgi:sugar/nucleoside kinase (ribokinase family)
VTGEPGGAGDDVPGRTRRLGILGTLVLDTIRDPCRERPIRAVGGLAYALSAFELRRPDGWSALPILKVGRGARGEAEALLDRLRSVGSRDGVRFVPEPNNRVELLYREDGSRRERLEGGVPGWTWEELAPLARSCDALYVNLIAGWELDLAAARRLRGIVAGPVYGDLHSLLLDRPEDGIRRPRVPDRWREWAGSFDYLQLNEDELSILAEDGGEEPWTLAASMVGEAPRVLFVTLGAAGAAWVTAREGTRTDGAGGPRIEAPDATGCGDVWGTTCFAAILDGAGPAKAVVAANRLAARNASLRGGTALLDAEGG